MLLFLPPIAAGVFSAGCIETEHVIKFVQFSLDASSCIGAKCDEVDTERHHSC